MNCKRFQMPGVVFYQREAFEKVGEQAQLFGKKALLISDNTMERMGYVEKCIELLNKYDVKTAVFLGVSSEPTDEYVELALEQFKNEDCDFIISLGGGSCIDTAKAVAVIATNGGDIDDYVANKKIANNKAAPHIAIPTTAGTGSEATDVTVITSHKTNVKMMIKQPAFMADVALVDPLLTISSPKHVTASTGVDALCHAVEAYISKISHPMSNIMALSAMELIVNNLEKAYEDGEDLEARENMSNAALQAGVAFSNASVCLVHGMSRPIGALFNVPHGFSNAMLLPAVLEINKGHCIDKLADLGRLFAKEQATNNDEEMADYAVSSVKKLCSALNIPNLKDWGIEEEEFMKSTEKMAEDALESGSPGNNPRVMSKEEIIDLYKICYDYKFYNGLVGKS